MTVAVDECDSWTTPMRVADNVWTPLTDQKVIAARGCVSDSRSDALAWVEGLFDHRFRVQAGGSSTIRFNSDQGSLDFGWD